MIFRRKKRKAVEQSPNYKGTGPRMAPPPIRTSGVPPSRCSIVSSGKDEASGERIEAASEDLI